MRSGRVRYQLDDGQVVEVKPLDYDTVIIKSKKGESNCVEVMTRAKFEARREEEKWVRFGEPW